MYPQIEIPVGTLSGPYRRIIAISPLWVEIYWGRIHLLIGNIRVFLRTNWLVILVFHRIFSIIYKYSWLVLCKLHTKGTLFNREDWQSVKLVETLGAASVYNNRSRNFQLINPMLFLHNESADFWFLYSKLHKRPIKGCQWHDGVCLR